MIIELFNFLKSKGIDVYFIGQHNGDCVSNYVVLKDGGSTSFNGKVGKSTIDVIFYIPKNKYYSVPSFKLSVIKLISEFGKLKYTGVETSTVTDDDKKAITFSIIYENLRKMEG